jgi:hypothetical protein
MGNSMFGGSDENTPLKRQRKFVRTYMPPDARRKHRFEFEEPTNTTTAYEASIDKYDYLVVFPFTEHKGVHQKPKLEDGDTDPDHERIKWEECRNIWKKIVTGTDEERDLKLEHLSKFWKKRTGSVPEDTDQIRKKAWYTIAREAIIDELTTKSGLQCKLTTNGKQVFCRIRAPIKLLELQADVSNYKLQFRPEIDPGSAEFFNRELLLRDENGDFKLEAVELKELEQELSKDEAMEILERLYKCGKIPPNELGIKESENQIMWSNRVHALERIADRVPIFNNFPCYGPFTVDDAKRYLFQVYSSVRGKTLFRAKDRLFLTKGVLDRFFNLEMLSQDGVVERNGVIPLHDANRGEKLTIEVLGRRWVRFWEGKANEVGTPYVTHEAYAEDKELWFFLRPFAQPLADVRDYFGEKIALYFAWLGFYTMALIVPLGLGLAMYGIEIIRGSEDVYDGYDWYLYGYYIFLVAWAEIYRACWKRENQAANLIWGTEGFEKTESVRPEFKCDKIERSYISNEHEPTYPDWKRRLFSIVSYSIIVWLVILDLIFIGAIFLGEYILITYFPWMAKWWMTWASSAALAIASLVAAKIFPEYAVMLNSSENHRTQTEYDDSFITKVATFQIINCYFAAAFTIFAKQYVFDDCLDTCLNDLRVLLYVIVACRTFWSLATLVIPWTKSTFGWHKIECNSDCCDRKVCNPMCCKKCYALDCQNVCSKLCCSGKKSSIGDEESGRAESANLVDDTEDDLQFMEELDREVFEGVFYGYADTALQFGYVCLFSVALPILPAIAMGENWVKLRVDAYKLCELCRRPPVMICEDIGNWQAFMDLMAVLGILSSVGIIVFPGPNFSGLGFWSKLVLFLAAEQGILLFTVALPSFFYVPAFLGEFDMNPEPDWIVQERDRQDFIANKFINATSDLGDSLTLDGIKGKVTDNIDVDSINLYDLRKNITISEEEYREMEKLEAERRKWNRDLKTAKDQLQAVYKQETFNEISGVGETKTGLPLGRVNIRLIQIEKLAKGENFDFNANTKIKVRVNIRGLRAGSGDVVPKLGPRGDSASLQLDNGKVVMNTSLGPFAPVKTIDAEIVFYIIDCLAADAIVAVGSVKLRELQDQNPVDKTLSLKVMQKDGTIGNTGDCRPRLFCTLTFQFSKVVPLRNKIYFAQDKLRAIEKDLVALKSGTKRKEEGEDA